MILTGYLELDTCIGDVIDITKKIADEIRESGLQVGIAVVFVPGATGAVTTIEHEPGLVDDIRNALERLAPEKNDYAHNEKWGGRQRPLPYPGISHRSQPDRSFPKWPAHVGNMAADSLPGVGQQAPKAKDHPPDLGPIARSPWNQPEIPGHNPVFLYNFHSDSSMKLGAIKGSQ